MKIKNSISDRVVLEELGARISRYRLNKNMTQEALAKEAGVSLPTLQRMEQGLSPNLTSFIRVMRALKLLGNIDVTVPRPPVSPIMQVQTAGKLRRRARSKEEKKESTGSPWTWGDQK